MYDAINQYYYYGDEDIEEINKAEVIEENIQTTPKVEKTVKNSPDTERQFFMSIDESVKTVKNKQLEQRMETSTGPKITPWLSFMEIGFGNYTQKLDLLFP